MILIDTEADIVHAKKLLVHGLLLLHVEAGRKQARLIFFDLQGAESLIPWTTVPDLRTGRIHRLLDLV